RPRSCGPPGCGSCLRELPQPGKFRASGTSGPRGVTPVLFKRRIPMKLMKLIAGAGLALAMLAAPGQAQDRISIGTGGTGGLFYIIGAGMAEVLNKNLPNATARAEVTGASVENIRRVA